MSMDSSPRKNLYSFSDVVTRSCTQVTRELQRMDGLSIDYRSCAAQIFFLHMEHIIYAQVVANPVTPDII